MKVSHINTIYPSYITNLKDAIGVDGKLHYFYKIVNNVNGKYYYGVHSTSELRDDYRGSGKILQIAYKKYGVENFTKHILNFFDDRKSLMNYEAYIVDKNITENNNYYNILQGGLGKYDLTNKSDYLLHTTIGLIRINNGYKDKLIKPQELDSYIQRGWVKGQLVKSNIGKILIHNQDNDELFIYEKELDSYIQRGWIRGGKSRNKNQISHAQNKIWINNNEYCKRICVEELQAYLDDGWVKGSLQRTTKGYIRITDGIIDKNIPPENTLELQAYLDDGWRIGSHIKHDTKIWINKNSKSKTIDEEDLQRYLDEGWKRGNPKNLGNSHNTGKIRVNNGIKVESIDKKDLQRYLDEGWKRGNLNNSNTKGRIRVTNGVEERFITLDEFEKYDKNVWRRGLIKSRKSK